MEQKEKSAQDDFSPEPPLEKQYPSKLDPFKQIILEWLEEDRKHWNKQHIAVDHP